MDAQSKQEFIELYKDAHEPLSRFCMAKSYGVMDAKDLLSETVLAAMEGFDKLRNKKAFLSYLFTIASNKVNATLRRRKFSGAYDEQQALAQMDNNGASDARFDISILYEALNELPESQKEAVILFEISGFSIKEIMEIQNSGESAVKQRIRRGREKLALLFSEDRRKAIAGAAILLFSQNANSAPSIDVLFEIARTVDIPVSQEQIISIINNHQVISTGSGSSLTNIAHVSLSGLSVVAIVGALFFNGNSISSENTGANAPQKATVEKTFEQDRSANTTATVQAVEATNTDYIASASLMESRPNMSLFVMDRSLEPVAPIPTALNFLNSFSENFLETESPSDTTKQMSQKSDAISAGTLINAQLRDCDVEVKIWENDYVDVQSKISFEAKNEKSKQIANKYLKATIEQKGKEVKISSGKCKSYTITPLMKYQKWSFDNGEKAFLRKVDVSHTIYVPANMPMKMYLAYGDLVLPDLKSDLAVRVFDGELSGGNVDGKIDLELRYSKGNMGTLKSGTMKLFEGDLVFKEANDIDMNARYSNVTTNGIKKLKIEAFEDKLHIDNVEALTGNFRYTKSVFKTIGTVDLVAFESKIEAESTDLLKVNSRYSDYFINSVGTLKLPQSFEDTYKIQKLKSIEGESKYSDFSISHLESFAEITTFEGKVNIDEVAQQFTSLTFDGRYTNYNLDFEAQSSYELIVDSKYTGLRYPEEKSSITQLVDKNETLKLNCHINKTENNTAFVKFNCFEGNIALAD